MKRANLAVALAILLAALPAYADFGLLGANADLIISLEPAHPGPGDVVRLTVHSGSMDVTQDQVVWRVNGAVVRQAPGTSALEIPAGGLGAETVVEADALAPDGTVASAQTSVIPTEIDLLFSADSYVPPFYKGRALPSAGTNLHLEARARFIRPDQSAIPASDIMYTWRRNNRIMGSVSGQGKFSIVIPAPMMFGTDVISVEAASTDGTFSGVATTRIPSAEPALILYTNHPLFGIMFNQALRTSSAIPGSETTFAAIPYFVEAQNLNDPALSYLWTVNGRRVPTSETDREEITINAGKSSGVAQISLALTHATNFLTDVLGLWNVTFSSSGGAADQFHSPNQ
jgi:hypothetical protein